VEEGYFEIFKYSKLVFSKSIHSGKWINAKCLGMLKKCGV